MPAAWCAVGARALLDGGQRPALAAARDAAGPGRPGRRRLDPPARGLGTLRAGGVAVRGAPRPPRLRVRHLHGGAPAAGRGQRARAPGRARRAAPGTWARALAEIALALHADFFVPSWLDRRDVVWVLLVAWGGLLLARRALAISAAAAGTARRPAGAVRDGPRALSPAVVGGGPVGGGVRGGRWPPSLRARRPSPRHPTRLSPPPCSSPRRCGSSTSARPTSRGRAWKARCAPGRSSPPPPPCSWSGSPDGVYQPVWETSRPLPDQPRLFHQMLAAARPIRRRPCTRRPLASATVVAVLLQLVHYGRPFAHPDIALLCALYAASPWPGTTRGDRSASGCGYRSRSCACSPSSPPAGGSSSSPPRSGRTNTTCGRAWPRPSCWPGPSRPSTTGPRALRLPVTTTLLALPVIAIVWTLVHHLGTDVALVVVGLHSLMFAYVGRERRDSPYNLAALGGFVAFLLIVFWSKLHLRVLHAYVIPVGLGRPRPPARVRPRPARGHAQPHPPAHDAGHAGQRGLLRAGRRPASPGLQRDPAVPLPGRHGPRERDSRSASTWSSASRAWPSTSRPSW